MSTSPLLYKYCPPDALAILQTGFIYLKHPCVFNDPFDLNPHYETTVYLTLPGGQPYAFPNARVINTRTALRIQHMAVLSLSANPNSLLMWAHYAAAHSGFLIGFANTIELLADSSPHRLLRPVVYAEDRPSALTHMDLTDEQVIFTKSSQWAYEQEWRLVDSDMSADGDPIDSDCHVLPFRIEPANVRELILGCRSNMEPELREIIDMPAYRHVRLLRCRTDSRTYQLNIDDITQPSGER